MEIVLHILLSALLFVVVIGILVLTHEFGHFIVAKLSGMRVDEFGLGFPPRALTIGRVGGTEYTLNWLPLGGFVRIYGESGEEKGPGSFSSRPRILQALVLVAGVTMNVILAYVLVTASLLIGTPQALSAAQIPGAKDVSILVESVLPDSPAAHTGLMMNDAILSATDANESWHPSDPETFSSFVEASNGQTISLEVRRASHEFTQQVAAVQGLVKDDPAHYAIGVEVSPPIGILSMSLPSALADGGTFTWNLALTTLYGLGHLVTHPSLAQVQGPIGIAADTLPVVSAGFGNLLVFAAAISVILAIMNFLPIPALDGGRFYIVIAEGVLGRRINPDTLQRIVSISFVVLILLLIVVSIHDVFVIVR